MGFLFMGLVHKEEKYMNEKTNVVNSYFEKDKLKKCCIKNNTPILYPELFTGKYGNNFTAEMEEE